MFHNLQKGGVVVSDSPVPVAKIDTACKSNISILRKKDHENVGINMIEFWAYVSYFDSPCAAMRSSSSVGTTPFFQYHDAIHLLQDIVLINLN